MLTKNKKTFKAIVRILFLWLILAALMTPSVFAQPTGVEESRFRLARQFEQLGQYRQAADLYKKLYTGYPKNLTYFEGFRRNLLRLKKYPELAVIIQDRLRTRPADIGLETQLGDVYFKMGDEVRAYRVWSGILRKHPGQTAVYRVVASVMLQNRLFDRAIAVYLRGRKASNKPAQFALELAQLYMFRQTYPAAVDEYLRFLRQKPYQLFFVRNQIARLPLNENSYPAVEKEIRKWVKKYPKDYTLRKLLAGFYQSFGNYESALNEILALKGSSARKGVKKGFPAADLYQFALDTYREKEYKISEKAFRKLLEGFPDFSQKDRVTYYLADISYQTKDFDQAKQLYRQVIRRFPKSRWSLQASLRLGSIFLNQENNPAEAIVYFERIVRNFPGTRQQIEATFSLADCYLSEGNLGEAVSTLQNSLKNPSLNSGRDRSLQDEALFRLAQVKFYGKDFKGSLKNINQILDNAFGKYDSPYVNNALDLELIIQENEKKYLSSLKLFASGMYLARRNLYGAAVDTLLKAAAENDQAALADRALLEAGRIKEKMKDWYGAIKIYQMLVGTYSQSVYADVALDREGKIYENDIKDFEKARQTYESILIQYPNSVLADELRKKVRQLEGQP
ncbi:tol-pal system protein YbgF [bacterium BMS3Abin05]|nr:tol-pal system protein YbgF [bacterium BMS3Abin05]GBE28494.1 tol-pal system protein YbgF [bacterium BMS3Bbin03]